MKNRKNILWGITLIAIALVTVLAACSSGSGESSSEGADTSAAGDYAVGSMMAVHAEGVIDPAKEYTKKDCLSCHSRESIDAATADYNGEAGVNPHAAHTEAYDCMTCHSIEGVSSLKCNACHDFEIPEGWENPPRESNVSNLTK